jgi:hypothetical protein
MAAKFWVLVLLAACTRQPVDATPDGAVREWLGHMEASIDDGREAKAAYGLLGPAARANLEERANRASQVEGRHVEPYEMLAEGHFGLRFRARKLKATQDGVSATVEVTGADPADRAQIHCVKEGSTWRVEPDLPDLQALPKRDGGT